MSAFPRTVPRPALGALLRDLYSLTKPRVTRMVVLTTLGGLWLAPGSLLLVPTLWALFGVGLTVGAANALNCWIERDLDARMERTRSRPLPAGRLEPRIALGFGLALGVAGVGLLLAFANGLTAALAAFALVSYVAVYTPLKQKSWLALPVGAVPGALPPLLGWVAQTGTIGAGGLALFGILFLWQLPHFIAIAGMRKDDYARAGFRVVTVEHGERLAAVQAVFAAALLLPLSLLPTSLGLAGTAYQIAAAVLGLVYLAMSVAGLRDAGKAWARRLFVTSLVYLPLLFGVLAMDAR